MVAGCHSPLAVAFLAITIGFLLVARNKRRIPRSAGAAPASVQLRPQRFTCNHSPTRSGISLPTASPRRCMMCSPPSRRGFEAHRSAIAKRLGSESPLLNASSPIHHWQKRTHRRLDDPNRILALCSVVSRFPDHPYHAIVASPCVHGERTFRRLPSRGLAGKGLEVVRLGGDDA